MKRILAVTLFLLVSLIGMEGETGWSFKGTVIKMRMADCAVHPFMAAMSGTPAAIGLCPEYTIFSDKVVYIVQARRNSMFMPLAEGVEFVIARNELVHPGDDPKNRDRFVIQQMTLRTDWDKEEARKELAYKIMERNLSNDSHNQPRAAVYSPTGR